ncbi:MAG: RT0821/Lpp0805 family surface protein [Pseudomonadota bacterium]
MVALLRLLVLLTLCSALAACASEGRPIGTQSHSQAFFGTTSSGVTLGFNSDNSRNGGGAAALGLASVLASLAVLDVLLSEDRLVLILSAQDRREAEAAYSAAFLAPSGSAHEWYNPASGNGGTVTALEPAFRDDGADCREFRHQFQAAGRLHQEAGTACRDSNGRWLLV